jgi:RDD family
LIGALIDLGISLVMFAAGIAGIAAIAAATGNEVPLLVVVLMMLAAWAGDALLYAVPLHRWGWSIGNLATRRRVVDAASGAPLPLARAVRRYFARRNVVRWLWDNGLRDAKRFEDRSFEHVAGVPLGNVAGLASLVAQSYAPSDPAGPTESHADRRAGSAVVRSHPIANV